MKGLNIGLLERDAQRFDWLDKKHVLLPSNVYLSIVTDDVYLSLC